MKNNLLLIAILLAFTSSAQQRLSVIEAQELGLQNNVKVKNAKLEVSLAKKKVLETIGIGLPKINGEVNWQQFLEIPTTVVPANMFVPTAPEGEYAEWSLEGARYAKVFVDSENNLQQTFEWRFLEEFFDAKYNH